MFFICMSNLVYVSRCTLYIDWVRLVRRVITSYWLQDGVSFSRDHGRNNFPCAKMCVLLKPRENSHTHVSKLYIQSVFDVYSPPNECYVQKWVRKCSSSKSNCVSMWEVCLFRTILVESREFSLPLVHFYNFLLIFLLLLLFFLVYDMVQSLMGCWETSKCLIKRFFVMKKVLSSVWTYMSSQRPRNCKWPSA